MINLRLWHPWENEGEAYKKSFLEAVEEYNETHDRIQIQAEGTEMEFTEKNCPRPLLPMIHRTFIFVLGTVICGGQSVPESC